MFSHRCNAHCDRQGCNVMATRRPRELCRTCPVLAHCRMWALESDLEHGIAGGMTESERYRWRLQQKLPPRPRTTKATLRRLLQGLRDQGIEI